MHFLKNNWTTKPNESFVQKLTLKPAVVNPAFLLAKTHFTRKKKLRSSVNSGCDEINKYE